MLVVLVVGPKTGVCFAHRSCIHSIMARIYKEICDFLIMCQLLLPLFFFIPSLFYGLFQEAVDFCMLETALRQLGQGHRWLHTTQIPYCLSISEFCLFPPCRTYGHWGLILLTYVVEPVFCLFIILPCDTRRQKIASTKYICSSI